MSTALFLLGTFFFLLIFFIIFTMTDSKFRLHDLIPVGGVIIGIALTAIGSIMILNTALKLYVFGFNTAPYFSAEEMCRYDNSGIKAVGEEGPRELTGEEKGTCITEKTENENKRYLRQKEENMIDGLAMLFVGIPFWIFFGIKRKQK